MKLSHLMSGVALAALMATWPTTAFAQSTGTQEVEKVVVTGQKNGTGGVIVKEKRPKTRSTVTSAYLDSQAGGQTIFQSINLVPGMVFTNSDAYGSSGGTVRLRGFDGNRVSLTVDGIPLNDTGNYAIFTNQMIDPEYLSRVSVNTGTTDVDSPTASATGGTVNVVTRRPFKDLTLSMTGSAGSWNYHRFLAMFDTGEHNGVSAFAGVSDQQYDKFKGPGSEKKNQYNARIYQVIGKDSYISLIGHYNENRNNFYRNLSKTEIANFGASYDNFATCTRAAVANGVASDDGASPNPAVGGSLSDNILNPSSCTNYYNLRINPSNTGNVRMQGNFKLSDTVRVTVDPSWQYVKANGGGTTVVSEDGPAEKRLGPAGLDLNGDGDVLDKVRLYTPNNTNTSRYGVNTSVIWSPDETDTVRLSYTADYGRHRQTGAFSKLDANGNPVEIFGGLDSASAKIFGTDGNLLRGRDRLSSAVLNQVSASYTGQFMDDALTVDVGLRAPFFTRDLNQYCYTQANSGNVLCTKEAFTDTDGDNIGTFASQGATNFIAPRTDHFEYDALLPNVGVSYELAPSNIVFASYAEGFSAPRTDNLYTFGIGSVGAVDTPLVQDPIVSLAVQPEKTKAFDLGYRYQGDKVTASTSAWYNTFENRIVTSFDPDLGANVDRNIGSVTLKGIDAELGWQASSDLVVYASASYVQSNVENNIPARTATGFLPTKGKELVETPNVTFSTRAAYAVNKNLVIGLQGKYVGERWATDVNDEKAKAYMTFDADLQLDLTDLGLKDMILQLNAINLLDKDYLGTISTVTNAQTILDVDPVTAGNQTQSAGTVRYGIAAPQTFQIQLKTKF